MTERRWDADRYDSGHSFVWERGLEVVEMLAPQPNEAILDLGCGTGRLAARIADLGASVVGVDSSEDMVRRASQNYPDIPFQVGDARSLSYREEFDAVFSNAALHWIRPPEMVVESVWRALKQGGRFTAEFGGACNIGTILTAVNFALDAIESRGEAVHRPNLYFPTIGEYAALLESRGFRVVSATHFERPIPLNGGENGLRLWLQMFGLDYLEPLSPKQQEELITRVEEASRPVLYHDGQWTADYWRIRVHAVKQA